MINFGHIISEAGLNTQEFKRISNIPIRLFDRKNREIKDKRFFDFGKKLFAKNPNSQKSFREFLEEINKHSKVPDEIIGQLNDNVLIIRPKGCVPGFFWLY